MKFWQLCSLILLSFSALASRAQAIQFGIGGKTGLFLAPVAGTGAEFHLSGDDLLVGLSYMQGTYDAIDLIDDVESTTLKTFNITGSLALAEMRYFFLGPLNLSLGSGLRNLDVEYVAEDDQNHRLAGTLKTASVVGNIGLGLMGRWDSFYLGLDLVALTIPTEATTENTIVSNIPASASALNQLEQDLLQSGEDLGQAQSAQVVTLAIGAMF
jgi:hypothetical protein